MKKIIFLIACLYLTASNLPAAIAATDEPAHAGAPSPVGTIELGEPADRSSASPTSTASEEIPTTFLSVLAAARGLPIVDGILDLRNVTEDMEFTAPGHLKIDVNIKSGPKDLTFKAGYDIDVGTVTLEIAGDLNLRSGEYRGAVLGNPILPTNNIGTIYTTFTTDTERMPTFGEPVQYIGNSDCWKPLVSGWDISASDWKPVHSHSYALSSDLALNVPALEMDSSANAAYTGYFDSAHTVTLGRSAAPHDFQGLFNGSMPQVSNVNLHFGTCATAAQAERFQGTLVGITDKALDLASNTVTITGITDKASDVGGLFGDLTAASKTWETYLPAHTTSPNTPPPFVGGGYVGCLNASGAASYAGTALNIILKDDYTAARQRLYMCMAGFVWFGLAMSR